MGQDQGKFPLNQRRLRRDHLTRELVRQVELSAKHLIQPYFLVEGLRERESITGLTGVYRETSESILRQIEQDLEKGINKALLFCVPAEKKEKDFQHQFACKQIENLKKKWGSDLWISMDVCLCSHTTHGHCGVVDLEAGHISNEQTVEELARSALSFAQAGADCVAPSDMMDGRIAAIRQALSLARLDSTLIMSYSAKFHSKFYGPFRNAADSAPKTDGQIAQWKELQDRATYQIDPAHPADALACSMRDAEEGADILMVKPGLPYLDVLQDLSRKIKKPWAVYQVSGEFAAIECLAKQGLISGPSAHLECWTAFVRAGASMIISYGARQAQDWIGRTR